MSYKSGDVIDPNEVAKRCRELGIRSIFTDEVPAADLPASVADGRCIYCQKNGCECDGSCWSC